MALRPTCSSFALAACLALLSSVPTSADARRKAEEPVAVWSLIADDEDRALAEHWVTELASAIDGVEDVAADFDRSFAPNVMPAEGVVVAIDTASRWLDAGWLAHSRREWTITLGLAEDALALVEPYPAARLPAELRRDLMLLRARALARMGQTQDARDALREVMFQDPHWEAHPRWEHASIVELAGLIRAEREGVPEAMVTVVTNVRDADVLISGVRRADTRKGSVILDLPAGIYEIAARKAGYTTPTETITLRPRQQMDLDLTLEVRNTAAFQESLSAALADPYSARRSDVWEGLRLASGTIAARGILTSRFEPDGRHGGTLQVGLYLPGRAGWAFHRAIELDGDSGDAERVQEVADELAASLDAALHPVLDEIASADQ